MDERHQDLVEIFRDQSRWRRGKANEYPGDKRKQNLHAAAIFDQLAATAAAVPDEVLQTFFDLGKDVPDAFLDCERFGEFTREVGFHTDYATAEEFCRAYIRDRIG
jgi:hypothetical protein